VEGDTVHTESKFSGGRLVNGGEVRVYDLKGKELLSGKTNAQGEFSFKIPQKTAMKIVLQAGMGHRGDWTIPLSEIDPQKSASEPSASREEEKKRPKRRRSRPPWTWIRCVMHLNSHWIEGSARCSKGWRSPRIRGPPFGIFWGASVISWVCWAWPHICTSDAKSGNWKRKRKGDEFMVQEPFALGNSLVHRLDPRFKIVMATLYAFAVALSNRFPALFLGLAFLLC
jgi:hypothetical protein